MSSVLENVIAVAVAAEKDAAAGKAAAIEAARQAYLQLLKAAQEVGKSVEVSHVSFKLHVSPRRGRRDHTRRYGLEVQRR